MSRLHSLFILVAITLSSISYAEEARSVRKGRRFSVGPSVAYLLNDVVFLDDYRQGYGLQSMYEFDLTDHFSLGIDLTYRMFGSGKDSASQLRYGLIMKHDFDGETFKPYLAYGLLMQVIRIKDVKGDGTAHDTKLAGGYTIADNWFVEAAYHISRLRYFNTNAVHLDYVEMNGGYVFRW